jgi:hypothetical protein
MSKRSRGGLHPLPTATSEDQTEAKRLMVLLESAAKTTTYDLNPQLWNEVLTVLNLDICYQVTIAEVLRRGTWRKAANPRAYIASAAVGKGCRTIPKKSSGGCPPMNPIATWVRASIPGRALTSKIGVAGACMNGPPPARYDTWILMTMATIATSPDGCAGARNMTPSIGKL